MLSKKPLIVTGSFADLAEKLNANEPKLPKPKTKKQRKAEKRDAKDTNLADLQPR